MITKDHFEILKFIEPYKITDPINCVTVLNAAFYKGRPNADLTDIHLTYLSEYGYIETRNSIQPYHKGFSGDLTLTPLGFAAIQSYQEAYSAQKSVNRTAKISLIFSAIAASPVIYSVIKHLVLLISRYI